MGYTTKDELLLMVRTIMCGGDESFQDGDDLRIRGMIIPSSAGVANLIGIRNVPRSLDNHMLPLVQSSPSSGNIVGCNLPIPHNAKR